MDDVTAPPPTAPKQPNLKRMIRSRAVTSLYAPRPAPVTFPKNQRQQKLYPFVSETIGTQPITYLEFGVFSGRSLKKMAELFTHPDARFIGFDSFEGLPEAWAGLAKGAFSVKGEPPVSDDPRVSFVKGYFQNSLPGFLANYKLRAPTLIHFDADLYSSTLFLMTSLWHHIPEYHFIFDEFVLDEAEAMYDFARSFPVEYEFLAATCDPEHPMRPDQVFGRLKNVPFTIGTD